MKIFSEQKYGVKSWGDAHFIQPSFKDEEVSTWLLVGLVTATVLGMIFIPIPTLVIIVFLAIIVS